MHAHIYVCDPAEREARLRESERKREREREIVQLACARKINAAREREKTRVRVRKGASKINCTLYACERGRKRGREGEKGRKRTGIESKRR
jgi:hypothetical protein